MPPATYVNHNKAKSSHCPFDAEREAGKLWILVFKVFWFDKVMNSGLPTAKQTLLPLHYRS